MKILFSQLFFFALLTLPIYVVLRGVYLYTKKNKRLAWVRELLLATFVVFLAALLGMVFEPGYALNRDLPLLAAVKERLALDLAINLKPFYTICNFYSLGFTSGFIINIMANVLLFIPCSFFLPLFWRRWQPFHRMLPILLFSPLVIECVQLFIGRSVDVDDWILNSTGLLLGYLLYRLAAFLIKPLRSLAR